MVPWDRYSSFQRWAAYRHVGSSCWNRTRVGSGQRTAVRRYVASLVRLANDRAANVGRRRTPGGDCGRCGSLGGRGVALGAYRFSKYLTGDRRPQTDVRTVTLYMAHHPGARERAMVGLGTGLVTR